MRSATISGPAPEFTGRFRRYVWCRSRELACVHGHRHKFQPFAIGVVGLTCTHREPPGAAQSCGVSVAYIPFPEYGRTLAVEASVTELTALLVAGRSREEALEYLGVVVMPEVRPAA
jgi:hypothetical protein